MKLNDKVAIVTGAARGIGKNIAEQLAAAGANIVVSDVLEEDGIATAKELEASGRKAVFVKTNVSVREEAENLITAAIEKMGQVDILVNNAGITRDNLLMRMKDDEWDSVIETNLTSAFRMSKACLRGMMKAKHGRIITITSVIGATGNPGQANYAATKAGVIGFTKSLAREIGSRGITVNAVAPGFIDTDMTRELPETQQQALLQQIPLARLGAVEDIANAVVFLASENAAYITGETIHVNGGMYMG